MATTRALINGRAYDYVSIIPNILGVPLVGVTSIEYEQEQAKDDNYSTGVLPESRGYGTRATTGTLEMTMNASEALRASVASRNLLDVPPSDWVIVFGNSGLPVRVHTLKFAEFKTDGGGGSQGDTNLKKSYSLAIADITYR